MVQNEKNYTQQEYVWSGTFLLTLTPWAVSFTPLSTEHWVGGTSILGLIQRTIESHEKYSQNPDRTAWKVQCLGTGYSARAIQIKYGLPYCVTCPSMSTNPGSLKPGTRRSRVPRWWDPRIRTNTGAGDTVLAKHT